MKEIYNNIPTTLDPHTGFNIFLFYKEVLIAVFQSIKLTEADTNDFYLERGRYVNPEYIEHINTISNGKIDGIIYSIKVNLPDFTKELQEVKATAMSSSIMPGGRITITAMSGTYEKLVDFTNPF